VRHVTYNSTLLLGTPLDDNDDDSLKLIYPFNHFAMPGTWVVDSALVPPVIKILPTATCHIAIENAVSWQLLPAIILFLNTSPPTTDS
jgi:hypothetical protein